MARIKEVSLWKVADGWHLLGHYETKTGPKIVTLARARTKSEALAKKRKLDAKMPFELSMAKRDIEFYWNVSPLMKMKRRKKRESW